MGGSRGDTRGPETPGKSQVAIYILRNILVQTPFVKHLDSSGQVAYRSRSVRPSVKWLMAKKGFQDTLSMTNLIFAILFVFQINQ